MSEQVILSSFQTLRRRQVLLERVLQAEEENDQSFMDPRLEEELYGLRLRVLQAHENPRTFELVEFCLDSIAAQYGIQKPA